MKSSDFHFLYMKYLDIRKNFGGDFRANLTLSLIFLLTDDVLNISNTEDVSTT